MESQTRDVCEPTVTQLSRGVRRKGVAYVVAKLPSEEQRGNGYGCQQTAQNTSAHARRSWKPDQNGVDFVSLVDGTWSRQGFGIGHSVAHWRWYRPPRK